MDVREIETVFIIEVEFLRGEGVEASGILQLDRRQDGVSFGRSHFGGVTGEARCDDRRASVAERQSDGVGAVGVTIGIAQLQEPLVRDTVDPLVLGGCGAGGG